jgi:hypothetical protein
MSNFIYVMKQQKVGVTIIIYLLIMFSLIYTKPSFLFNQDDSIKPFGVGYQTKSILSLPIISILVGILSYMFVLHFLNYSNAKF